jgi:ABC-type nitrate/sulfonate/bicarbonate transport system permease component
MSRRAWLGVHAFLLLAVWKAITVLAPSTSAYVLPSFSEFGARLVELVRSGELIAHVTASLGRTLTAFALAALTGVPLGMFLGTVPKALRVAEPLIEIIRPISPIAWIPLAILWFGLGEASKIFIIWLLAFFFILLSTIAGAATVDRRLVEVGRTLGASRAFLWRAVTLRAATPSILVGLRLGLAASIGSVLVAEIIAANTGVGFMMERARVVIDPAPVLIGMAVIGVLGYTANRLLLTFERRMLAYRVSVGLSGRRSPS